MKKIVTLICIVCIGISIVGCASSNALQGSEVKTVLKSNTVVNTGTKNLKLWSCRVLLHRGILVNL